MQVLPREAGGKLFSDPLGRVAFVLLLLLMGFALYNDLVRLDAFKFFR